MNIVIIINYCHHLLLMLFIIFSEHEWFKIDLPEYLFPSASDVDASVVDTDAIREVCEVCS